MMEWIFYNWNAECCYIIKVNKDWLHEVDIGLGFFRHMEHHLIDKFKTHSILLERL